jgi:hypothetical protein
LIRLLHVFFALLAGVHSFVSPTRKPDVAAGNKVLEKTCEPFHFLKNPSFLGLFYAAKSVFKEGKLDYADDCYALLASLKQKTKLDFLK